MGITTDGSDLYVTDWSRHIVISVDKLTGVPTTIAGLDGTSGNLNGTGTAARFYQPSGICTDGPNLYVCDTSNGSIRKIVIATGVVTTVANGLNTTPYGITTDGTVLYVTNYLKHTISKISIETGTKTILAGQDGVSGTADGTGTAAQFNYPWGICTDGIYLYVADYVGNRVRKIHIDTAAVTTIATGVGNPRGITTDGIYVYLCAYNSNYVRKVLISTGAMSNIGSIPNPHYITTDGTKLYITDETNYNITVIE
jgi:sugar lactone lactonase YvrE